MRLHSPLAALLAGVLATFLSAGVAPQEAEVHPTALRIVRVMDVRPGKDDEVRDYLHRRLNYLIANHADFVDARVHRTYGPRIEVVSWTMDFENGWAAESLFGALEQEEGWAALDQEAAEYFDLKTQHFLFPASPTGPGDSSRPFRWTRSLKAKSYGQFGAALRHARAIAEHINATTKATYAEVYSSKLEDLGRVLVIADFDDLESWRRVQSQLWMDDAYIELLESAEGVFEAGSWEESFMGRLR
jgi:hypothetical protein